MTFSIDQLFPFSEVAVRLLMRLTSLQAIKSSFTPFKLKRI